jgi:hypothetical protein
MQHELLQLDGALELIFQGGRLGGAVAQALLVRTQ